MLSTYDGTSWSAPSFVDNNPVVDEANPSNSFTRGHQFMPQVTFNGGRLTIVYYDLRLDHTLGLFNPVPGYPKPTRSAASSSRRGRRAPRARRRRRRAPARRS